MVKGKIDNDYLDNSYTSIEQKKELERYQKYLKSIKKYDPLDEEEYLFLTRKLGNIINQNEKLSDIEVLELTTKLQKIEYTQEYTVELLELTRQIKKITKIVDKELPKVSKKENPCRQVFKSLTATSILPKIKPGQKAVEEPKKIAIKKEEEKKEKVKEKPKKIEEDRLTLKGLVEKNNRNNPTVEHFDTQRIQTIRTSIEKRTVPKKKVSKSSKVFWNISFYASIILLLVLVYNFVKWEVENVLVSNQITSIYEQVVLEDTVTTGAITDVGDLPVVDEEKEEEKQEEVIKPVQPSRPNDYWYYMSMSMLNVNFDELTKKNPDTVGWIKVNGGNVNYPYVQTTNNDYYLNHSFDRSYNGAGWVFLDYRNDPNNYGRNNIIYAHSRLDNTMFGSLRDIITPNWYNNTNNHIVKTSTKTSNAIWQVFSVYTIKPESYYIKTKFSDDEFTTFINTISSRSVHDFGVEVTIDDKILTLSTCYFDNKRVVLHAKLIRLEEK